MSDDYSEKPWQPITDRGDLKHLVKLAEECAELSKILARCVIQGMDGVDPSTGEVNRVALQNEIADVAASSTLAVERFDLDMQKILVRSVEKTEKLRGWHAALDRETYDQRVERENRDAEGAPEPARLEEFHATGQPTPYKPADGQF